MVIFDTNILIELQRGNLEVRKQIETLPPGIFYLSTISAAEFLAGARDKEHFQRLRKQLDNYTVLPLTAEISEIFSKIYQDYLFSHRPQIPDMLIAATALYYNLPMLTINKRDFQFINGVDLT